MSYQAESPEPAHVPSYAHGSTPAGRRRRSGRGPVIAVVLLVLVALAAAAYVFLWPVSTVGENQAGVLTSASAPTTGGDTVSTDTALYVDGPTAGDLTSPQVTCARAGDSAWAWTVTGTVGGQPAEFTFNTNYYRGTGDYRSTTVTDDQGGQVTGTVGDTIFATNGNSQGVFSVAEDELSGSMDVTVEHATDSTQQVRLSGTWRCS